MANDRIWMKCKFCGNNKLLYKYYPGGGGYYWSSEEMDKFMTEHILECNTEAFGSLKGEVGFVLWAESQGEPGPSKEPIESHNQYLNRLLDESYAERADLRVEIKQLMVKVKAAPLPPGGMDAVTTAKLLGDDYESYLTNWLDDYMSWRKQIEEL